ncbi:MAG: hypothetical protein RL490_695 [Pseudomonadota bacterium]|jgi:hypothetical protein
MKISKSLLLIAATASLASPALANSFTNGGFEILTNGPGQLTNNTVATGWTVANGGYTFAFAPGTADTSGANGQYGGLSLWGPGNGAANGLPATSPSGGNFIAFDGAFQVEPLQQVITGLTAGKTYKVGFDYGFAQQAGFDGATEQNWTVNFAGQSATTATYNLPNHGFSGWMHASYNFIANNATETLSFVGYGNLPVPPFALLDGVTFSQESGAVPEPASWAMLLMGFGMVGAVARRRNSAAVAA